MGTAAAVVTNITRLNPPRPLIGETSELSKADSLDRVRESDEAAPCPVLGGGTLGSFEILRPSLRGNCCREVDELLRLQTKELIPGLTGLQRARSALA